MLQIETYDCFYSLVDHLAGCPSAHNSWWGKTHTWPWEIRLDAHARLWARRVHTPGFLEKPVFQSGGQLPVEEISSTQVERLLGERCAANNVTPTSFEVKMVVLCWLPISAIEIHARYILIPVITSKTIETAGVSPTAGVPPWHRKSWALALQPSNQNCDSACSKQRSMDE